MTMSAYRDYVIVTAIIAAIVLLILASSFPAVDPSRIAPRYRLLPPDAVHWFGTDQLGRDVFWRVIVAAKVSVAVGGAVAVLAIVLGTMIALACAINQAFDYAIMRITDAAMAIPAILLAIVLVALFRGGVVTVVIAIAIPEIPRIVRVVRSVALTTRAETFVEASLVLGTSRPRILLRHILPATFPHLAVTGAYVCGSAILIESGLSFLGAGVPPDIPTWGNMIAAGRLIFEQAPWLILAPGIFITATVLAFNILGDAMRDLVDPQARLHRA